MHSLQCTLWKKQKLGWFTRLLSIQSTNQLGFSPAIMHQGIVIFHCPPVSVMIRNNFRIIELGYLSIKQNSLFLLTLQHSQTRKGWHHHDFVTRILKNKKLNSILPHSPLRHPTPPIFDLKQLLMPSGQYRLFLSMNFHKLPSSSFTIVL